MVCFAVFYLELFIGLPAQYPNKDNPSNFHEESAEGITAQDPGVHIRLAAVVAPTDTCHIPVAFCFPWLCCNIDKP